MKKSLLLSTMTAFLLIGQLLGPIAHNLPNSAVSAAVETVYQESLDSEGSRWKKRDFIAPFTGAHEFTLSWDEPSAAVAMSIYELPARTWKASTPVGGSSPQTRSVDLTEGVTYEIAAWAAAGSANVSITLDNAPEQPPTETVQEAVVSGQRDSSNTTAPRWGSESWSSPLSGEVTAELTWEDQNAQLRFAVYDDTTGAWINSSRADESSGVTRSFILQEDQEVNASVWATSGASDFTLTFSYEQEVDDTPLLPPDTQATREVHTGRVDTSGVSGNIVDAIPYTPIYDGTLYASLNFEKSAGIVWLYLKDENGTVIFDVERPWNAKGIQIAVEKDHNYTLEVVANSGAADYHMEVYVVPETERAEIPVGERPNIILVNTDDQRYDSLRYLPKIESWFVDQGLNFPNGYVTSPTCCPSRSSLFSGQYNHNNGVIGQTVPELNQTDTLQSELYKNGYYTAFAGKYVHFWPHQIEAPYWDNWTYFKGGYENIWINFDLDTRFSTENSTITTFSQGINYIDGFEAQDPDRPWFLHLTPVTPHSPATPEDQYQNAPVPPKIITPNSDEQDLSDKPPFVQFRQGSVAGMNSLRENMIRTLYTYDDQVDRLMNHLQNIGELENTMVILTSDNGFMHGDHGLRSKFLPYDESIRVPFLVYWDGQIIPGTENGSWVSNIDLAPTVLAAAGIESELAFDGQDIFSPTFEREWVFTEYFEDPANNNGVKSWSSIRNDQLIYTEYYETTEQTGEPIFREYYDLINDPWQLENMLADGDPLNDPDTSELKVELEQQKQCSDLSCQQ